ncbi:hypothetical protein GF377_07795 [candidate division GN15 bacterium]|nr:hypothetical protein [candidate division GN15 bacterium]
MRTVIPLVLLVLAMVLGMVGCEPVDDAEQGRAQVTEQLSAIPAEFGELEAVTVMPEYPGWFQLWFEDEAGTVRQVRIHPDENLMHTEIHTIKRSGAMPVLEPEEE